MLALPLIVTLALDPKSAAKFDALRQKHFPTERNLIAAHMTLFHNLPGNEIDQIVQDMAEVAGQHQRFEIYTAGTLFLGRGVAIRLSSKRLLTVHADLSDRWRHWLTPQDKQPFRPHVTIQNFVAPEVARELETQMKSLAPFEVWAEGLDLWLYRGGPWQHLRTTSF